MATTNPQPLTVNTYAIAEGLIGFGRPWLRVKITRIEGSYVWVTTADLADAGTALTLDAAQVKPEPAAAPVFCHPAGLVSMA